MLAAWASSRRITHKARHLTCVLASDNRYQSCSHNNLSYSPPIHGMDIFNV